MSPCGISGRIDAGLHKLLKEEARKRKTSMLTLQRRMLKNIPTTPLDLFAENEGLFEKTKK